MKTFVLREIFGRNKFCGRAVVGSPISGLRVMVLCGDLNQIWTEILSYTYMRQFFFYRYQVNDSCVYFTIFKTILHQINITTRPSILYCAWLIKWAVKREIIQLAFSIGTVNCQPWQYIFLFSTYHRNQNTKT